MALRRGGLTGLRKVCVLGRERAHKGVSHRHALGDEGTEVKRGRRTIRVGVGECPHRVYFVP
jgi:hypothetical protein